MNENLNLVEILKDCPKGTKLYSPALGEVEFEKIIDDRTYPIRVIGNNDTVFFTSQGKLYDIKQSECLLFPSKEQRDWSKFKRQKFNPNTLKPFDRVLVRNVYKEHWLCRFFSHIVDGIHVYKYATIGSAFRYCIPYNDDTKHLVDTTDEAPEFYRHWED